jgi:hypothetical protein
LRILAAQQVDVQRAVEDEIRELLDIGHSWTDIGRALGISRQGARQRYLRRLRIEASPPSDALWQAGETES